MDMIGTRCKEIVLLLSSSTRSGKVEKSENISTAVHAQSPAMLTCGRFFMETSLSCVILETVAVLHWDSK